MIMCISARRIYDFKNIPTQFGFWLETAILETADWSKRLDWLLRVLDALVKFADLYEKLDFL